MKLCDFFLNDRYDMIVQDYVCDTKRYWLVVMHISSKNKYLSATASCKFEDFFFLGFPSLVVPLVPCPRPYNSSRFPEGAALPVRAEAPCPRRPAPGWPGYTATARPQVSRARIAGRPPTRSSRRSKLLSPSSPVVARGAAAFTSVLHDVAPSTFLIRKSQLRG